MAKISGFIATVLLIFSLTEPAFARDPVKNAGLRKGQNYEFARKRLLHLGYRIAPTNLPLINFEADKTNPEITCGYLKDAISPKSLCAVSFENRRGDYISLELRKTRWGYVLDEL